MSEKLGPNLKKLLIDESRTICHYKVTNDKKTYNDHDAFIFNMHKKINKNWQLLENKTQWRFTEAGLKKLKQITNELTTFNNSFTQQLSSLNLQKQYDQWEKKVDTVLYTSFENINIKRTCCIYQQELND